MTGHIPPESTNACPTSPTTDIQPELLPCPFCGGEAKRFTIEDEGDNFGGDVIACTGMCGASSHVEFGRKENLVSLWNTRLTFTTPTLGDMVMVPREMTDEMASALAGELMRQSEWLGWEPTAMWSALLSAAPASPIPTSVSNEGERIRVYIADLLLALQPFADAAERADAEKATREGPGYNGPIAYPWNYVNATHFADAFALYSERLDPDDLSALSPALDNTAVGAAFKAGWDKCWCRDPDAPTTRDGGRQAAWEAYATLTVQTEKAR